MVTFELGSKLSKIELSVFNGCSLLSSICIPSSIETTCKNCFNFLKQTHPNIIIEIQNSSDSSI
jgi:hypothetical protein